MLIVLLNQLKGLLLAAVNSLIIRAGRFALVTLGFIENINMSCQCAVLSRSPSEDMTNVTFALVRRFSRNRSYVYIVNGSFTRYVARFSWKLNVKLPKSYIYPYS